MTQSAERARMEHFHALSRQEQARAIRDLAATGQGEHTIAHATGLSVEMVRRVLAEGRLHSRGGDRLPTHTGGAGNSLTAAGATGQATHERTYAWV
jgi:hypothetical protein